jgi:hypothetical protein
VAASFCHEDLRGRSFVGRDLAEADFSECDLRGVDFSGANLRGASFRQARMGLGARAVVIYMVLAIVLGAASGLAASWTGEWIRTALQGPRPGLRVLAVLLLSEITVCAIVMLWRGASFAITHVALPTSVIVTLAGLFALATKMASPGDFGIAIVGAFCVLLVAIAISVGALARVAAVAVGKWPIIAVLVATVAGVRLATGTGVALIVAIVATIVAARLRQSDAREGRPKRALAQMMTLGGTSFHRANLAHADYSGARLRNTDFSEARIDGTRWTGATGIGLCRFDPSPTPSPESSERSSRTDHRDDASPTLQP